MAHGVRRAPTIKVHQSLHGYADGHRQLAVSVPIKPKDAKTMLVLSDLSGPGASIDAAGYLTGYPLTDSKMYAFARTWPAPEMSRPGCVWTHTLLLDFGDIATLSDASAVLARFRRPENGDSAAYTMTLEVPTGSDAAPVPVDAGPYVRALLASLYGSPRKRIIAPRTVSSDVDALVTALWGQQWPRLRRSFRFCTFALADRSTEGGVFDLQFLPSLDRSVRIRFPNAAEATEQAEDDEKWLGEALADLLAPDARDLRTFLRRIGGDVASGRSAFRPLCRLHGLVNSFATTPASIDAAISLLEVELGSAQARAARSLVASAALDHTDRLDGAAVDFIVRNLDLADLANVARSGRGLGARIWKQDPTLLVDMLEGSERQQLVARDTLADLDTSDLLAGLRASQGAAEKALALRPDLLISEGLWRANVVPIDLAFSTLADAPELRQRAVDAMIMAGRDDLSTRALGEVGASGLLRLVARHHGAQELDGSRLQNWLRPALSDPGTVAEFLSEKTAPSWSVLAAIAAFLPPDAVPNDYGADPWLIAVRAVAESQRSEPPVFLSAYLLSRALGFKSRDPGELAQIGFEQVHDAASRDQLPEDAWHVLQTRLPWSFSWLDWDRCPRIRAAVADLFVDRDLSPDVFAQVAANDRLFSMLIDTVARRGRGRRYLKIVRRCMQEMEEISFSNKIRAIDAVIK